jgi:hypothetical protein
MLGDRTPVPLKDPVPMATRYTLPSRTEYNDCEWNAKGRWDVVLMQSSEKGGFFWSYRADRWLKMCPNDKDVVTLMVSRPPAIQDPTHESQEDLLEWIGGFDPKAFDAEAVKEELAGLK